MQTEPGKITNPPPKTVDEKNIFQPDIFFIRKDNLSIIGEKDPKLCNE